MARREIPSETPLESERSLSGLVVRKQGELRMGNPIYAWAFDADWVSSGMA